MMEPGLADRIVTFASEQANPPPYGFVNDASPDPVEGVGVRRNWRRLKDIFEVAGKYTDANWRDPAVLDGVRGNNKRVPQAGTSGINWCGVFATYCWIKGGNLVGVRWGWPNVVGANVKKVWGNKGVGKGDIAVIAAGNLNHHFIVEALVGAPDDPGTTVKSINGNSDYQGITKKSVPLGTIVAYYTYEDAFLAKLNSLYGSRPFPTGG